MINTTKGPMDEKDLVRSEGQTETETECTQWIEYHLEAELVHRSVHLILKELPVCSLDSGE